jgi:hypothetical protein
VNTIQNISGKQTIAETEEIGQYEYDRGRLPQSDPVNRGVRGPHLLAVVEYHPPPRGLRLARQYIN